MWKCYLLSTCDAGSQKTYVGVTPDLERRLKQHNGVLSGGAKATHGRQWERICHVSGFPDHTAVLQFEWRWKQLSRPTRVSGQPLERRLKALQQLLALEKPTTNAQLYSEYTEPLEVVVETEKSLPYL
jgi:predicted GIY-YIG superfamily endonuclease